jgi:hypothetical protein
MNKLKINKSGEPCAYITVWYAGYTATFYVDESVVVMEETPHDFFCVPTEVRRSLENLAEQEFDELMEAA